MTEPEPPEEIDFDASDTGYLRVVMGDNISRGEMVSVTEDVWLFRIFADRNLWELVVDGEGVDTFDADMIETSSKLHGWIRKRVKLHHANNTNQQHVEEEQLPGGFQ